MYNKELKKRFIKEAIAALTKAAYTPPAGGAQGAPPGGMDPNALMSLLGGVGGGGMPPMDMGMGAPPADMGGGAGMPPMGMGGGMPPGPGPSDMGGMTDTNMPPTDMSGIEPTDTAPGTTGGADSTTQLRSALAILKEGLKQLERAVDAMAGPKTASHRASVWSNDPIQDLIMYLNSLG